MKKVKSLLAFTLLLGALLFAGKPKAGPFTNYAWYTTDGQFVAWSTLVNTEVVTGGNTDPANGTLISEGYTQGGPGEPPSGTLVYKIYSHP